MHPFAAIGPSIARRVGVMQTDAPMVYRTTAGDPTEDATQAIAGTRAVWIVRNGMSRAQISAAGGGIYASDWFAVAELDADIQAGDVISDGTRAFVLTAAPETDQGFLLASCEITTVPD